MTNVKMKALDSFYSDATKQVAARAEFETDEGHAADLEKKGLAKRVGGKAPAAKSEAAPKNDAEDAPENKAEAAPPNKAEAPVKPPISRGAVKPRRK